MGYVKPFPVLPPSAYKPQDLRFLIPRVLELAYTAWDLAPLAQDVWQEADEGLREVIRAFLAGARLHPDAPPEWVETLQCFTKARPPKMVASRGEVWESSSQRNAAWKKR